MPISDTFLLDDVHQFTPELPPVPKMPSVSVEDGSKVRSFVNRVAKLVESAYKEAVGNIYDAGLRRSEAMTMADDVLRELADDAAFEIVKGLNKWQTLALVRHAPAVALSEAEAHKSGRVQDFVRDLLAAWIYVTVE